jgi:hypothetical protein
MLHEERSPKGHQLLMKLTAAARMLEARAYGATMMESQFLLTCAARCSLLLVVVCM